MFTFRCDFHLKKGSPQDLWNGPVSSFLGALLRNGQITEDPWNPLERKGSIRMYLVAPARDALSNRYFNADCTQAMRSLRRVLWRAPEYRCEGLDLDSAGDCRCRRSTHFILFTNFLSEDPPVRCGDCDRRVPLYRLPHPEGHQDYSPFRTWMKLYKAADQLYIDSGFGERFGSKQMSSVKSPLTRMGRDLCRDMAKRVKRHFYYYLHGYERPLNRPCPGCGRAWKLDIPYLRYSHRCDRCDLISCRSDLTGWLR